MHFRDPAPKRDYVHRVLVSLIVDPRGRPISAPRRSIIDRTGDWEGRTLLIMLIEQWLSYDVDDVIKCAPNEGRWLVRTGRGIETEEAEHGEVHDVQDSAR